MQDGYRVGIVGATGAVGGEFVRLFEERSFPISELRLFASSRSVGRTMRFSGRDIPIEETLPENLTGLDIVFFSAGAARSKALIPALVEQGTFVIDNSSAFRMDPDVALVIPEVNGQEVLPDRRLFAVPNCTAIILLVAVNPLQKLGKVDRLIVSTYQSASGGGAGMMRELEAQTHAALSGGDHQRNEAFPPYAFNLFSHNTAINEHGYNEEEWKVIEESRKILGRPELKINVTCVRVPVLRAHSETVTVEFAEQAPTVQAVREALQSAPGVTVLDDRERNDFPTPLGASGQGNVLVGRIRQDVSNSKAISMFISGDQLLKGAALNAVQIAERLISIGVPIAEPTLAL